MAGCEQAGEQHAWRCLLEADPCAPPNVIIAQSKYCGKLLLTMQTLCSRLVDLRLCLAQLLQSHLCVLLAQDIEEFVKTDPYVKAGLVSDW